jgi:glycerophosphoryl diester phosphodiesterase
MPFRGNFTQEAFLQKVVSEYRAAGVPPASVHIQSFERFDLQWLMQHEPDFGRQAILLDEQVRVAAARALVILHTCYV